MMTGCGIGAFPMVVIPGSTRNPVLLFWIPAFLPAGRHGAGMTASESPVHNLRRLK
jgi:hypothetical protein